MPLLAESIDYTRPMRVAVIGAGFSASRLGCKLARLRHVEVVVYEKNADVGGVWHENRYPGVGCDVPSHCYQYTFEQKTDWSTFYSPGAEIQQYLRSVAEKYGVCASTKFLHEVRSCVWDEGAGKWRLAARDLITGLDVHDAAEVVVCATGALNRWRMPDIPGIESFQGKLIHSASYTLEAAEDPVWKERRVAVIGYGSSATQIVPALTPHVKHIANYVRGRTWVYQPVVMNILDKFTGGGQSNHRFSEEEKARWAASPEAYLAFRRELEDMLNSIHAASDPQGKLYARLHAMVEKRMREKLARRPDIADALIPDFPVTCRRLVPATGYLEVLMADNAEYINTTIDRITRNGIVTVDGMEREYDVIITATGFDVSFVPPFPIIGREGRQLRDDWADHPKTYLGLCQDGFPNCGADDSVGFQLDGPNTGTAFGSLIPALEKQADYVIACIEKMQRERIASMEVKAEAVAAFQQYAEAYFPKTAFSAHCSSWYKNGTTDGPVTGLWPGSVLHQMRALETPRFEDYQYTFLLGNRTLDWLGDGSTIADKEGKPGTRAWYLDGSRGCKGHCKL